MASAHSETKTLPKTFPLVTRIEGKVYDFTEFADVHPGGAEAIKSLACRDGTLPFLYVHNRDKGAKVLLRKYLIRDPEKRAEADRMIPSEAPVDRRMAELFKKYDATWRPDSVPRLLAPPLIAMAIGVAVIMRSSEWSWAWWAGIALWAWAVFRAIDMAHMFHHNAIFDCPLKNRVWNEYYSVLIAGICGRLSYWEHSEHHASPNILGYDKALEVPVIWRSDSPDEMKPWLHAPAAVVLSLGSIFGFGFTTMYYSVVALIWGKIRMDRARFWAVWALRTAVFWKLVGPVPMFLSYMIPMVVAALEATTMHFDQPIMLPEEYHKSGLSFVELQVSSVLSYKAPEHWFWRWWSSICIALDHTHHHLLPNIIDFEFPQHIKDEIDGIITEELGIVPVQRDVWTAFVEAYSFHFGVAEARVMPYREVPGGKKAAAEEPVVDKKPVEEKPAARPMHRCAAKPSLPRRRNSVLGG